MQLLNQASQCQQWRVKSEGKNLARDQAPLGKTFLLWTNILRRAAVYAWRLEFHCKEAAGGHRWVFRLAHEINAETRLSLVSFRNQSHDLLSFMTAASSAQDTALYMIMATSRSPPWLASSLHRSWITSMVLEIVLIYF